MVCKGPARICHSTRARTSLNAALIDIKNLRDVCKSTRIAHLSWDCVKCVRCLQWPVLAAKWPIRNRDNGWPDQATINGIVSYGCYFVAAVYIHDVDKMNGMDE